MSKTLYAVRYAILGFGLYGLGNPDPTTNIMYVAIVALAIILIVDAKDEAKIIPKTEAK